MQLLIKVTPVLNKHIPTEKAWVDELKHTLEREFGMGDLNGEDLTILSSSHKVKTIM